MKLETNAITQQYTVQSISPQIQQFEIRNAGYKFKISDLFSESQNNLAALHMNRISASVLSPRHKDYISETSLFYSDRETVLVFGGINPHNPYAVSKNFGRDIFRYVPYGNTWELVGEIPEPRQHHSVTFMNGRVYLVGGTDPRDDDVRGRTVVVDTVWSYDPAKRSWFSEASLIFPRKNFGLVVDKNCLYAVGGQDRSFQALASVEKFDSARRNWKLVSPMIHARIGLACVKYRNLIWASGGLCIEEKGNRILGIVESYYPDYDQWTEISNLRFPRCFHRMFEMSDKLFLIGGAGFETEKDPTTSSLSAIDQWDIKKLKWMNVSEMAIPRHGHTVGQIGTQFLIIGGVTTIYMRALSNVECFCIQRGTWIRGVAPLPYPVSGHATVTLPPASLLHF